MEEEVLFETRQHISNHFCSFNYPPQSQHQLNGGVKGRLLSYLSVPGVGLLKEKWSGYRHPRKLRKLVSLFVSPTGQHVAVAVGNQIAILRKDNEYQEPCGFFTSGSLGTFTAGTWSESHDILGISDDNDILYFIKANGDEITRITKQHLKVSSPIAALIAHHEPALDKSVLCIFNILMSDGSFHEVEISQEPNISSLSAPTINNGSVKKFPKFIFCVDYHYGTSLLAVVGAPGSLQESSAHSIGTYCLSLWRRSKSLNLELISSTKFKGLYSKPKGQIGQVTIPKLLISPEGQLVATLDLRGCLSIFKLRSNNDISVLNLSGCCQYDSSENCDIVDLTWWSDHILVIVKKSGVLTMIDALTGNVLLEKDDVYSLPVLQSPQLLPGNLFLLENLFKSNHDSSAGDSPHTDLVTDDDNYRFDVENLQWSLLSFLKRSVSDMYDVLINKRKYQSALDFANVHGLDKDEVLKSQWLHSSMGINEVGVFLSAIKDQVFVISECVDKVGSTEDATHALISHGLLLTDQFRFSESETYESSQIWDFRLARLKLLQFRDKLETFLGINMGRFSVQEYKKFRSTPVNKVAVRLAESGKIGALNLIFKRHPYSLAPFMIKILAAIPETVPVQSYEQLLPGNSPPSSVVREKDWVECQDMIIYINKLGKNHESHIHLRTEPMVKQSLGFAWPSLDELCTWYKSRAIEMDSFSGQLENSLGLIEFACRKGINALQQFHEDISYLHTLIYSDEYSNEGTFTMSLVAWERLHNYEKFTIMLKGVNEENVLQRLNKKAIPFMKSRFFGAYESFVVRWLKEIASENKLDICLKVIEEGAMDPQRSGIFRNKVEAVECALECIYLCTSTDKWNIMSSILSKLPETRDPELSVDGINNMLKLAEGHVEAGRLLAVYQVPKPIDFFLEAHSDGKGVKQIIRLVISKFIRRQPARTDNDWATMWRDFQSLQEKAFTFLDKEYMLMEFCRGLLKAGKFSLARNYLRGTASVDLTTDKAENLVIQAARESFFSASSLSSPEIWKARECLNLLQNSRNVRAEADIIDALTVKLPNLGVNILPLQYKQIKDPMEIIRLAITTQIGAYLNVDGIIEVAKLLGLNSQDEISAVQEAIAREAAVAGDIQLAFDLCLLLAKKGHGSVWDLCAAMARGNDLENVDISSRKQLLGFALSYCDDQSIGELLHAWKDIDTQEQCERLMTLTGTTPNFEDSRLNFDNQEEHVKEITKLLSLVAKNLSKENNSSDLETLLQENGKTYSFGASQLPWLLELSRNGENNKKLYLSDNEHISVRTQTVVTILSWLARNGFAPRDDLISSLAKSIMEPPVTEEEDIIGTSFLLNLVDAFHGVEIIEEQVRKRETYSETCSIMSVGMLYSLLHNSIEDCEGPFQRRELLLRKFREKHSSFDSDDLDNFDTAQSSFWREWKQKLEEKKHLADESRMLDQLIPGVQATRFLSGDSDYRESVLLSHVESIKLEKKFILKDVLKLASTYGLNKTKVLVQYLRSVLVSEVWEVDDMTTEISEFKDELLDCSAEIIELISLSVYPLIDGHDKLRLAFVYGLLSNCYNHMEGRKGIPKFPSEPTHLTISVSQFSKVKERECHRVSFIESLNFKNIAGLDSLNFKLLKDEIYNNVDEHSIEALATMVENLKGVYIDLIAETIISSQDVYRHHVFNLFNSFEAGAALADFENIETLDGLLSDLEQVYSVTKRYLKFIAYPDVMDLVKRFFTVIISSSEFLNNISTYSTCCGPLVVLVKFWIRVTEDLLELYPHEYPKEKRNFECLICCLKVFAKVNIEGIVSSNQGWGTVIRFVNHFLKGELSVDIYNFCREMVSSGCGVHAIAEVYHEVFSQLEESEKNFDHIQDLPHLYICILDSSLQNLAKGSNDHQDLINMLSTLGKSEGDVEDLNSVRRAVWEKMEKFSDDKTVPDDARVYVYELMRSIANSDGQARGFSAETESNILPWENWDNFKYSTLSSETNAKEGVEAYTNASTRLTSNLVQLRSSQLARSISQNVEITLDDLSSVNSAVGCFLRLSEEANSEHQIDALIALLGEWEGLYMNRKEDLDFSEPEKAENDWENDDDWNGGWESFQEETVEKETEQAESRLVHPLHACWVEVFKKLVTLSRFERLPKLVNQSLAKSNAVILDEDEVCNLSQKLIGVDCFVALKVALLFPYEAIHTQCLGLVEEKLKQGTTSDKIGEDYVFLILILSSGLISSIISSPLYDTTFSLLSFIIGNLSRRYQEAQLSILKDKGTIGNRNTNEGDFCFLFEKVIFPCFVAELVKADQPLLAGFLVTKFMHTNASLSLINIAEATLRKYLETQLRLLESDEYTARGINFDEYLVNTYSGMRGRIENLIRSALLSLTPDSR